MSDSRRFWVGAVLCLLGWVLGCTTTAVDWAGAGLTGQGKPPVVLLSWASVGRDFWAILANNALVALLISVGGLLTGGLLAVLVSVWNGVLVGLVIRQFSAVYFPGLLPVFFLHAPLELLSFVYYGAIGTTGYTLFKRLQAGTSRPLVGLFSLKRLYFSTFLLVLAALVEALIPLIYSRL